MVNATTRIRACVSSPVVFGHLLRQSPGFQSQLVGAPARFMGRRTWRGSCPFGKQIGKVWPRRCLCQPSHPLKSKDGVLTVLHCKSRDFCV